MEAAIFYSFVLIIFGFFSIKYKWSLDEIPADFKMLFTDYAQFKRQNHDKHVWVTALAVTGVILSLLMLELRFDIQVTGWPWHVFIFISALVAAIVNAYREGKKQKKGGYYEDLNHKRHWEIPFDFRDIRFGIYSGLLTGAILAGLIKMFI